MVQEILTYIIVVSTSGYVIFRFARFFYRIFIKKTDASSGNVGSSACSACSSGSCKGCPFAGGFDFQQYNKLYKNQ